MESARPLYKYDSRTLDVVTREGRERHRVSVQALDDADVIVATVQLLPDDYGELLFNRRIALEDPDNLTAPRGEGPTRSLPPEFAEFADVFDESRAEVLPPHRAHDHEINLEPGKEPPPGRLYSLSHKETAELHDYVDKMLRLGFIRPSKSPHAAPVLFVPKKDGRLRLCVDYRALNNITIKDRYPIPLISMHLDRLGEAVIFTKLDLKGAYNLLRIALGHEWKTAFRTSKGSFEYLVMPFGLCNAPSTFQRLMNEVFADILDLYVIVYLDDILIFSRDASEHTKHVAEVLRRLRANSLFCALDKCEFAVAECEFLGFKVTNRGVTMDTKKVEAILQWPEPESIHDIQSFLGFANFYRRFIRHYSRVVAPLTDALKGGAKGRVGLSHAQQDAFNGLKKAFTTAPILTHWSPDRFTVVETDASDWVCAAVLSQWVPKDAAAAAADKAGAAQPSSKTHTLHPVAFWSRKMTDTEHNYAIHDKELLAIVLACKEWRHYLHGLDRPFDVLTDHQGLTYFQTKRTLNRRQGGYAEVLSKFDFKIHYRPGTEGGKPDALTRRSDLHPNARKGLDQAKPDPANHKVLLSPELFAAAAQLAPPAPLRDKLQDAEPPDREAAKKLKRVDGIWQTARGQPYVPPDVVPDVLAWCHDARTAGHAGLRGTLAAVEAQFWWPTWRADIRKYVSTCAACRRSKKPRHRPYGYLLPLQTASRPWGSISMDYIEGLPPSKAPNGRTYDSILVTVDRLTKAAVFTATNATASAKELAYDLHRTVFAYYGLPDNIVSDRGRTFVSAFWTELLRLLDVKPSLSTAYHPQTDGQTERSNQTLEGFLRLYCNYQQDNWAKLLPTAMLALNSRPSATTKVPPNAALNGYLPKVHPALAPAQLSVARGASHAPLDAAQLHQVCRDNVEKAAVAMQTQYNKSRMDFSFEEGEAVYLRTKHLKTDRPSAKLDNPLMGPFTILEKVGKRAYRLDLPENFKVHPVFHISMLEPTPDGLRESQHAPQRQWAADNREEWELEEIRRR
ncbi:uncharacterized protein PFL1_06886 [Pseudozyma flocculosa PF-1]|uniref:Reverse transcriptase n=1 Tax=Pseudozyma flocculosa PF-1 TaxID=1277687 RepID=A0A061H5J2_9BASI|nr:uncharacterized protein PFL1_06886 [Pseudozyma flocculosa PF-1]EPQ27719.1 hypothetical protein PFL1_06886 [Pseudozyma flocculosa PF-1]